MNEQFEIVDWTGNKLTAIGHFKIFEDAEAHLEKILGDDYKTDRQAPKALRSMVLPRDVVQKLHISLTAIDKQRAFAVYDRTTGRASTIQTKMHYTGTKCALKSLHITTNLGDVTCKKCLKAVQKSTDAEQSLPRSKAPKKTRTGKSAGVTHDSTPTS